MVWIDSSALPKSQEDRLPFLLTKIGFYDVCQMHSLGHIWASHILWNERFAWFVCPELEVSWTKQPLSKNH